MPIQLNDDTIDILYSNGTISYTIDKSYDDSNVISLLSTSNITFLEGGGGLNVNGNINFTGDLTKGGEVFSSYDDTDVISLLSTSNITLFNSNIGIGKSEPGTTIDVVGNINISTGSRYQVNGSDLSFNEVDGILTLEKGGTGRTTIDEFKTMLGISTSSSEYEITDISPAYFNLTTTGKVDINDVDYMEPMTFTIYGKNFDRNIRIKIVDNSGTIHTYINTIYYDSPVKIRAVTKYIKFSEINQVDKYPYKIKIYHKDDITKHAFSGYIYKDENDPTWLYDNNYRAIYNIDNGFEFTINDSDTNNILSYELVTGAYLIPNLSFNSQTGKISGIPEIFDTDINLTINAKSGSISLPTRDYTLHIFSDPKINTVDQELLVSNYFDLLAESKANVIQYADTSITWSLIDYDSITEISDTLTYYKYISGDNTEFISLSGNRIIVSNLNSLGIDGKYITLEATDAYGYSITKTINIKKLVLSGPTIHTGDQELLSNTFNLSATSAAGSISDADTNVYWSLNGDYSNISLSGNTINVTDLDLLEELGKDIIVLATDAYGYSSTKTINIKKKVLPGYFEILLKTTGDKNSLISTNFTNYLGQIAFKDMNVSSAGGRNSIGQADGFYESFFTMKNITKLALIDGSAGNLNDPTQNTNYIIYDLVESSGNESMYEILNRLDTYAVNNNIANANSDTIFGDPKVTNFTAGTNGYSGTWSNRSSTNPFGSSIFPDKICVWGINRDSDNDTQIFATYWGNLETGKGDYWRNQTPSETLWSLWGNDWNSASSVQTVSNHTNTNPGINSSVSSYTGDVYLIAYSDVGSG